MSPSLKTFQNIINLECHFYQIKSSLPTDIIIQTRHLNMNTTMPSKQRFLAVNAPETKKIENNCFITISKKKKKIRK